MAIEPDEVADVEPRWDRHKHFPRHVTETARALSLAGYTSSQIAAEIKTLHDVEITPRTISYWRSDFPNLSSEEQTAISQANREIALTAQRLTLDDLTNNPTRYKATELMVISGIAQDKELNRLKLNQDKPVASQRLVFVFNGTPQIIASEPDTE